MFRIRQHSSTVVKYVDKVLTKPITYIVNLSITGGIVCNQLKSAWVQYYLHKQVSLLCIISKTLESLFTGMVVTIDLRKVFDTVDHQILSNKLQAMGVFNIKWFQSYLTGRKPLINVDNSKSYLVDISCVYQREVYWAPYIFFIMSMICPSA